MFHLSFAYKTAIVVLKKQLTILLKIGIIMPVINKEKKLNGKNYICTRP